MKISELMLNTFLFIKRCSIWECWLLNMFTSIKSIS